MNTRPAIHDAFGNEAVLVFMHIPKTAGNTFLTILQKQYQWGTELHSAYPFEPVDAKKLYPGLKCVAGHHLFGLHRQLNKPYVYTTFLREPIDRVISDYYFTLPTHGMTLEQYLSIDPGDYSAYNPNERQTRWASGINSPNLHLAVANLTSHFPVIGITEYFDESLFLMKKQFGWGDISYRNQNITPNRPATEQMSPAQIQRIAQSNQQDTALYYWAVQRLRSQLAALQPSELAELAAFKRKQKAGGSGK